MVKRQAHSLEGLSLIPVPMIIFTFWVVHYRKTQLPLPTKKVHNTMHLTSYVYS